MRTLLGILFDVLFFGVYVVTFVCYWIGKFFKKEYACLKEKNVH